MTRMARRKVAVFMGTRPEAIKMAPVVRALQYTEDLLPIVVSTGQHREMLQQVVDVFQIPIHHDLDVMQPDQSLAGLSARILQRVDVFLESEQPDFALVQGDTTTVLMASLACFYRKIPLGHIEAGLRTGNLLSPFPEEANRKLVTPLAALHFSPTEWSQQNLLDESIPPDQVQVTGNTVIDALHLEIEAQEQTAVQAQVDEQVSADLGPDWRSKPYVLITGHRRENFGDGFQQICQALGTLAKRFPETCFIYPVHLNPQVRQPVLASLADLSNVFLLKPLPYRPFVALMKHAQIVLTDSGGVQEEAPGLGVPVLVMRDTTERPEGLAAGTVKLVGARRQSIVDGVTELLTDPLAHQAMSSAHNPYGDGHAAGRIARAVQNFFLTSCPSQASAELAEG
jgi:UDP-N-acetylglucosamine 2-epimerase (non-hydrolysing)